MLKFYEMNKVKSPWIKEVKKGALSTAEQIALIGAVNEAFNNYNNLIEIEVETLIETFNNVYFVSNEVYANNGACVSFDDEIFTFNTAYITESGHVIITVETNIEELEELEEIKYFLAEFN